MMMPDLNIFLIEASPLNARLEAPYMLSPEN